MAREISHEVLKSAVRKLVTDVVEPDISVENLTVKQEVNSVIDVGWKDIFKSSAGPPREVLQIWLVCHNEEEEPVYAFTVGGRNEEKIQVTVRGCKLNMIIDSGASTNIIEKQSEV